MHISHTTFVHIDETDIDGITIDFSDAGKPIVRVSETFANYSTLMFENTDTLHQFAQRLVMAHIEHRRNQLDIEAAEAGWRVYQ